MDASTRRYVRQRAGDRCEYCHMPQEFDDLPFQIEHVVPRKHHGTHEPENLAVACYSCNLRKGPNLSGIDPATGKITRLFNPRADNWETHFKWNRGQLSGRTDIGRATIDVLAINLPFRVELRDELISEGVFP